VTEANLPGPIVNTATAVGTDPAGGKVTASDTETVALIYTASIEIAKSGSLNTGSDGIANPGDTITYTFTVVNTGDVTLTGVTVTDPLVTVTGGPITLAPGETDPDTFTGLYTLTQADIDAGKVDNTATAVGTPPVGDNVTDTDSETVDITQGPAISLVKDVDDNEAAIGQTLSYSYTVENTGNVTLTGVTLSDDILGEITLGSVALAPGDATTGSATHTVTEANLPGPIVNTATAVGTDPAGGKVTASDTETVALIYTASISVTKTPDVTSATVGDTITYTYTVENTGNVTLTNLEALDNRLGGVTFDKTTLAPNETVTGVLQKVVSNDDLPGPIDNRVDAKALDPVGNEVTDSASATVELYYNPHPPVVTRGSITLNKSGLESTDVAGFTLYDSEGDAVGGEKTITGNGTVKWSGLRRDTYKIVETTVPSGYLKMDDITDIVISSSKLNHSFDRTNTKVPSTAMIQVLGIQELPFTGLNPAIPISGIFIIIAGLAMVMLSLKRNKYNDLEDKSN
ncbi:MAG: SpaA isopeptide-forming pilin-related protein, partial [Actinomycetota bacterium]|nr:SpaA isopeptide-forming pilin-related protein [Actinomycetota bacterium]